MVRGRKKKTELEKRLEAELTERNKKDKGPHDEQAPDLAEREGQEGDGAPGEPDIDAALSELEELKDQLARARAEFDNYRKRVARDAEQQRQRAAKALIMDLLPVVDHLELALRHADDGSDVLAEGVGLVLKQTLNVLTRHGVEPIDAVGEPFDPTVHEAVMQRESPDCPPNTVIEEFQKGYRLGDFVLRPAKVIVCAESAERATHEGGSTGLVDEVTPGNGKIDDVSG